MVPVTPARPEVNYVRRAEILRVVDGDTLELLVDQGMQSFAKVHVRLLGVDTAETHGVTKGSDEYNRGMEAKLYVLDWVDAHGGSVIVRTVKDKRSFNRYIADVWAEESSIEKDAPLPHLQSAIRAAGFDKLNPL